MKLFDLEKRPIVQVLSKLLEDKTTKHNIIWATSNYESLDKEGFSDTNQITEKSLTWLKYNDFCPRVVKSLDVRKARTRMKAEVFTPSWICNKMNNHCDSEWFGRKNVFNTEIENGWFTNKEKIVFPKERTWKEYIDSTRIEIACGEAPFLVSRYDVTTGEFIPIENRVGILDRKFRVIHENVQNESDWYKWSYRALKSIYGYEYQGDNLLIARINVLLTFCEYTEKYFGNLPEVKNIEAATEIITWNIWQMDALKGVVPNGGLIETDDGGKQGYLFDMSDGDSDKCDKQEEMEPALECRIRDWQKDQYVKYNEVMKGRKMARFSFAIGNPPYQDETLGDNVTYAPPVYHMFMDAAFTVADKVEMIHPARFLFNAGSTPKLWNEKMLSDKHFKVLLFEQNSGKIFVDTDIKGGLAISYRDVNSNFGAIGTYTSFTELNSILKKVYNSIGFESIIDNVFIQNRFVLENLYSKYPDVKQFIGSDGKDKRLEKNIFVKAAVAFSDNKQQDDDLQILGIVNNKRTWKFIARHLIDMDHENINHYKVILPTSNGSGAIGEVLSTPLVGTPLVGTPLVGYTRSFISIGSFDNESEANACLKYIKSKFARTMLGVLKITQDNNRDTWKYVPLQEFTSQSDIDWTKSISEIDKQLYKKYGLSQEEIDFIETHVKEME